jgi:hypothetical protein
MPPRLQVIASEYRVESDFLGKFSECQQVDRAKLLSRGFVSKLDHVAPAGPSIVNWILATVRKYN